MGMGAMVGNRMGVPSAAAMCCWLALAWPDNTLAQSPPFVTALGGGETCLLATPIPSLPFSDTGTTCGATDDYAAPCPGYGGEAPDVVYTFTPASDVVVNISLCAGSDYDTRLIVYANACPGVLVGCSDDECSSSAYPYALISSLSNVSLTAGVTYYIVIDGYDGACGTYTLDVALEGGDFGACCNDALGTCVDGVQIADCPAPMRFVPNATCDTLDPPCGAALGPCCHGDGTCTLTTAAQCTDGVWLGPAATCAQCPCFLPCPSGAIAENEACGTDTNGGCDTQIQAFELIAIGQSVCGTVWQENFQNDVDWFQVTLAATTQLTWTVEAEFPVFTGLLGQTIEGLPGCDNLTGSFTAEGTGAGDCQPVMITSPPLAAGTYYLVIATNTGEAISCAYGNRYVATLTGVEVFPDIRVESPALSFSCVETLPVQALAAVAEATAADTGADLAEPEAPVQILAPAELAAAMQQQNGRVEVIVTLKKPAAARKAANFRSARLRAALRREVGNRQDAVLGGLGGGEFALRRRFGNLAGFSGSVTEAGLAKLKQDPRVATIEPVRRLEPHLAQGLALMHATVPRSTYNGAGIAIAICDTGIDYNHPMLGGGGFPNSKVIGGYDFGEGDADPMPVGSAHGTCCAGIAAGDLASVGDYVGGVAYNAKLYALKITTNLSSSATSEDMIAAWDWCVTHKDDDPTHPILVISTSFGGGEYGAFCDGADWAMTTAANNAAAAGITVLCSSGNDGFCAALSWPACISSVISVGAVYDSAFGPYKQCLSGNSCVSKTAGGGCPTGFYTVEQSAADKVTAYSNTASILTLLAPSNQAYTTDMTGPLGYNSAPSPSGDYLATFGGTSAACPYAAGAVACLQQAAKGITGSYLSPVAVKAALALSGDQVADPKAPAIIKPRINLEQAIAALVPCDGQVLTIHNDGMIALVVNSVSASPWLTLTPLPATPLTIPPGSQVAYCVAMNCTDGCHSGRPLVGTIEFASNDPDQPTLTVPVQATCPAVATDFDGDGDVDLADVALFTSCFSGPAVTHTGTPLCTATDLDHDGDVDQTDYAFMQACFSGSGTRADPNCTR